MSHLFCLDQEHPIRIMHLFPGPVGTPRIEGREILSGIIRVIHNDLRWRDAPSEFGPHETLCKRFVRWSAASPMPASKR